MATPKVKMVIPPEFGRIFDKNWRYAVIEGGRNSLKSHTVARALLLLARSKNMRMACLRQFQANIGDSSHQLLVDLCEQYGLTDYDITDKEITNSITGSNFVFKGLDRNVESVIKGLEGVDVFWVDEAQTISEKSLRVLVPTARKKGVKIIFTMNRITDLDPVIKKFVTDPPRDDVWHLQVDYRIAAKYGFIDSEALKEIEYTKLHDPETYAHDYLGQAINQTDRNIITARQVMEAMAREPDTSGAIEIGADIARLGNDRIVFVKRKGLAEIDRITLTKQRIPDTCDQLERFADFDKEIAIKIDDTGVGGGVTDEMIRRGYKAIAINFGAKASDPDKYPNLISEAWFHLASIIDRVHLSENKDLLTELSSREWKMDEKGRRRVESKDDYKKRGYRSPDEADATILAFYEKFIDQSQVESAGEYYEQKDDDWDDDTDDGY